jgi:hypothetical protein
MPYVASAALIVVFAVVVGLMAVRSGGRATEASSSAPNPIVPRISVSPATATGINPTTPLTVTSMDGQLTTVTVTNTGTGTVVTGVFTGDDQGWHSTEDLGTASPTD